MTRNFYTRLIVIILIAILAIWIDTRETISIVNPINDKTIFSRNVAPRLGLDLRGGLQVLLEADLPEDASIDPEEMSVARTILENRTNALGVSENLFQVAGERFLVGEFPGAEDAESILTTLRQTGLLEFVDMGFEPVPAGTVIETDFGTTASTDIIAPTTTPDGTTFPTVTVSPDETQNSPVSPTSELPTEEPSSSATATLAPEGTPTVPEATPPATDTTTTTYHTVMTGRDLATVSVGASELGKPEVQFTLTEEGAKIFEDYTKAHTNQYLGIVLDKQVISTPIIQQPIPGGSGRITGNFTIEEANALTIQLRYGSLPIPLKIVETRIIGPTLGADSLQKSLIAGLAGMIIVILFMSLYYRLPGIAADISIIFYAMVAYALFKYVPVTLTLPGIAGFLLSTGAALDANILIFERLKEELRSGMPLRNAVDRGWSRAWPSIRDSNIAALITSAILFWFGNTFGATIVKGFSFTLALGVIISLFTAWFVTRTLLALFLEWFKPKNFTRWFGI